jgi:integrase
MRSTARVYLYKRNNGRYYLGKKLDGKIIWRSTGETNRSAALTHLKEFSELARGAESDSLKVFTDNFLGTAAQRLAAKTLDIYRRSFRHFKSVAGDCQISRLSGEHWDRYKSARLKTVSPTTVNIELRALKAALHCAVRWQYLGSNPFSREKLIKVPDTLPAYFTMDDMAALKKVIDEPLYWDLFFFAALSGCRREEIITLRWSDYDPVRRTITIHSAFGFKTKTGRIRVIPLHSRLCNMLDSRRQASRADLIFECSGKRLSGNNLSRRLRYYVREAGLNPGLHFHSLRHYAESRIMPSRDVSLSKLSLFPLVNSA